MAIAFINLKTVTVIANCKGLTLKSKTFSVKQRKSFKMSRLGKILMRAWQLVLSALSPLLPAKQAHVTGPKNSSLTRTTSQVLSLPWPVPWNKERDDHHDTSHRSHVGLDKPPLFRRPGAAPNTCPPRKTLVLDLDETLVHSSGVTLERQADMYFSMAMGPGLVQFHVYKRPHVDFFLSQVARWYHVVVYTASLKEYAAPVIDALDPMSTQGGPSLIQRRYYRESCYGPYFAKNLSLVDDNANNTIIVDNSPHSYVAYPDNAIPVETWICNPDDTQLADLVPFLQALRAVNDVRSVLKFRNINRVRR